jgi:hypothetical protein
MKNWFTTQQLYDKISEPDGIPLFESLSQVAVQLDHQITIKLNVSNKAVEDKLPSFDELGEKQPARKRWM